MNPKPPLKKYEVLIIFFSFLKSLFKFEIATFLTIKTRIPNIIITRNTFIIWFERFIVPKSDAPKVLAKKTLKIRPDNFPESFTTVVAIDFESKFLKSLSNFLLKFL